MVDYEKTIKLLKRENKNLRDDLNRIEEIKDKERMKMVKRLSELEEEVEKKDRLVKVRMKKWKEK